MNKSQKATNPTRKRSVIPVRLPDLGFHITDLLHALGLVKGVRKCASSMDENLFIRHIAYYTSGY